MARAAAVLPSATGITDCINLGLPVRLVQQSSVARVLAGTGRQTARHRDSPARVLVHCIVLMRESAMPADADPDVLSFIHAVRIARHCLPRFVGPVSSEPEGLA